MNQPNTPTSHGGRLSQRVMGWVGGLVVVVGGLGVTVAGFALSYDAIRVVGVAANVRPGWAWMLPVSVDGAMGVATVAILVLGRASRRPWYPWLVVAVGVLISMCCNSLHSSLRGDHVELPVEWARLVAAIPALMLALSVHLIAVLAKELFGSTTAVIDQPAQVARLDREPASVTVMLPDWMAQESLPAQVSHPEIEGGPTDASHLGDGPPTPTVEVDPPTPPRVEVSHTPTDRPRRASRQPTTPTRPVGDVPDADGLNELQRTRLSQLREEFPGRVPGVDAVISHMKERGISGFTSRGPVGDLIKVLKAEREREAVNA